MRALCCDECGARIVPEANAFRLHDPRGFSDDHDLCSPRCLRSFVLTKTVAPEQVPA